MRSSPISQLILDGEYGTDYTIDHTGRSAPSPPKRFPRKKDAPAGGGGVLNGEVVVSLPPPLRWGGKFW